LGKEGLGIKMEPMDMDSESPRGTKRKADDLSVVTAPRRIKVRPTFSQRTFLMVLRLLIQMLSTKSLPERLLLHQCTP
jgi:hypothetical protein